MAKKLRKIKSCEDFIEHMCAYESLEAQAAAYEAAIKELEAICLKKGSLVSRNNETGEIIPRVDSYIRAEGKKRRGAS